MSFKFEYKIIDNFFDKNDLDLILGSITEENKKRVNDNEIKIFPNRIFKNNVETSLFSETNLKYLNEKYHSKCIEILKMLSPKKVDLYDYSEFDLNLTGKNYKFPIHSDTPNKLFCMQIKKGMEKKKLNGKKIELYFFLEKKMILGILTKETETP